MSKFWDNMGNTLNKIGQNIKDGWNNTINDIQNFFNPTRKIEEKIFGEPLSGATNPNISMGDILSGDNIENGLNTIKEKNNYMSPIESVENIKDSINELIETKTLTPVKGSLADIIDGENIEPNGNAETINQNNDFNINEMIDKINSENKELQKMLWDREDAIRKEAQEREDSAYQRAVADARKAGINLNLLGINPAQSSGGITQASKMENVSSNEITSAIQMMINSINNNHEITENQKERNLDILKTIATIGAMSLLKIK